MKRHWRFLSVAELLLLAAGLVAAMAVRAQVRELGVRQPPETVFEVPVEEVMPRLSGASPTRENGRVGGELVFWGYRLADGSDAYLFACVPRHDVDCEARIEAICLTTTTVLERAEHTGEIAHRHCRGVAVSAPGDLRPGCSTAVLQASLAVGLVTCG